MSEQVTLDTVHSDVWHLYYLLDAVMSDLMDMEYVRDGKRDVALDRVAALSWIARDQAERIGNAIGGNYHQIKIGEATEDTFESLGEVVPRVIAKVAPAQSNYQVDEGGAS